MTLTFRDLPFPSMSEDKQLLCALFEAQRQTTELQHAYFCGTLKKSDVMQAQKVFSAVSNACFAMVATDAPAAPTPAATPKRSNDNVARLGPDKRHVSSHMAYCPPPAPLPEFEVAPAFSAPRCVAPTALHSRPAHKPPQLSPNWDHFNLADWSLGSTVPSEIYRMWYAGTESMPSVAWMDYKHGCRKNWVSAIPGLKKKLERRSKIIHTIEGAIKAGNHPSAVLAIADRLRLETTSMANFEQICKENPLAFHPN